jgi:hypothetical protein
MKEENSADFIALVAVVLCFISGSFNLHLMAEINRIDNEYQGFKHACAYNK